MKDEFANRQAMHHTVIKYLEQNENRVIWEGKAPVIFGDKVLELKTLVADLGAYIRHQEEVITGHAEDKAREEKDVEELAFEIGSALAGYFSDHDLEADAKAVGHPRSRWRQMRDETLLEQARLVRDKLADRLMADAAGLAKYGLESADVPALEKEIAEYVDLIASPFAAISGRRALTVSLRPKFREVGEHLKSMDRLVPRFRSGPAGRRFADGWKAARVIRDLGGRTEAEESESAEAGNA